MDIYNAIRPGFVFSQDFETDPGAVPDAAELWLNLVRVERPSERLVEHVTLQRLSPVLFRMALTAEQTLPMRPGAAAGEFIQRLAAVDQPLGVRVTIPIEAVT